MGVQNQFVQGAQNRPKPGVCKRRRQAAGAASEANEGGRGEKQLSGLGG
jgi:hypothetical protein